MNVRILRTQVQPPGCHKVLPDQLCDCWDCPPQKKRKKEKTLSQGLLTCSVCIDPVNVVPPKVTVLICLFSQLRAHGAAPQRASGSSL